MKKFISAFCSILLIGLMLPVTSAFSLVNRGSGMPVEALPEELKSLEIKDHFINTSLKRVGVIHALKGHVVVIHDSSVTRTTGRRWRVESMTLETIRQLDAGHRYTPDHGRTFPYRGRGVAIPTLEEVLEAFPEACLNVEIKRSRQGVERVVG